jgi:hypothetical protein
MPVHKIPLMKTGLFLFLLFFTLSSGFPQFPVTNIGNTTFTPADSEKLLLHIVNKNFFKNNEYFNPIEEGYTLIGFLAEPSLVYYPGKSTRLEAGVTLLKYQGRGGFYLSEPLLRFQYHPAPFFQMIMGRLYGGTQHGLIEPLYQWERDYTSPVENGLQFLFNTSAINADIWLDWEKFILPGDPFQEQLTYGTTVSWKILPGERKFNLYIPGQVLVGHHGGQINALKVPLQTIADYATGIKSSWEIGSKVLRQINTEVWYLGYNELSPTKQQAYKQGFGIYPKTEILLSDFILQAGYFHGEKFEAPKGERLFHSANIPADTIQYRNKDVISFKFAWQKKIDKGILLAAYFETYTSFDLHHTDYTYGVHLIFDRDFFLARVK